MSIKKILLGGIPLGCNNIGDEAIINSVCQIFHRLFPSAELTVMTDDTVDVAWCSKRLRGPLYGFNKDFPASEFASFVKNYDCYVWAGATGLSDYPQVATELLNQSFAAGVPAIVWNVGMNSELNPAFFRVGGKRKALLRFGGALFFGKDSLVALYDCWHVKRMRRKIKKSLSRTALVIVRDPESVEVLHQLGFNGAIAGADSAILQENASQKYLERDARFRTIGLCISAQSELKQMEELVIMLNKFLERTDIRFAFIPMNLKTDGELLNKIREKCADKSRILLMDKSDDPGVIQDIASQCDVVISSRLHLLILCGNVDTPMIGIARGSKVNNFLNNYNLQAIGSVDECDFNALTREVLRLLAEKEEFQKQSKRVHQKLLKRLAYAEEQLQKTVNVI